MQWFTESNNVRNVNQLANVVEVVEVITVPLTAAKNVTAVIGAWGLLIKDKFLEKKNEMKQYNPTNVVKYLLYLSLCDAEVAYTYFSLVYNGHTDPDRTGNEFYVTRTEE